MPKLNERNARAPRTNAQGVDLYYEDALGKMHETSEKTVAAVLHAMGLDDPDSETTQRTGPIIIRQGERYKLKSPAVIEFESGDSLPVSGSLPPDVPLGYHRLRSDRSDKPTDLIVSPGKCWLPPDLNTWGWATQLYAARSRNSWGIGDFADLETLARWSAQDLGAGMMLLNPLSAASPMLPQQDSPYFPTSRAFLNLLSLHIEWVPGANSDTVPDFEEAVRAGRALNEDRHIDRDAVFRLKMRALDAIWARFPGDPAFTSFCQERGASLALFATYCALAERYRAGWHSWPKEYSKPSNSEVQDFARANSKRVQFYQWIQWLLDGQLARCAGYLSLMQDLPIGVDPDGADAWIWQDIVSQKAGVGAPPDEFNTQGQNWGLPPYIPHKLRAAAYRPLRETIKAAFRHGGGLRIDHVMGLLRLFWIPQGMSPAEGAYVRYNADEMLAIVALESVRAKAYVVGEDLGTVEESTREKLAAHRILSYRLLWFEKEHPREFPREALAAVTTHDLPTVRGLWTGSDLAKQRALGLKPNEDGTREIHERLQRMADLEPDTPAEDVIASAYALLAEASSRILTAALDDAAAVDERPNIPATNSEQNPNWCIALPISLEELMERDLPRKIAGSLQRSEGDFGVSGTSISQDMVSKP
ncbi:MAG: 4-alpha-glucanotransferase [Bryobacteraceae bacterium]